MLNALYRSTRRSDEHVRSNLEETEDVIRQGQNASMRRTNGASDDRRRFEMNLTSAIEYADPAQNQATSAHAARTPSVDDDLSFPEDLAAEGVKLYMDLFQCQPHPLLSYIRQIPGVASAIPTDMVLYPMLALCLQVSGISEFGSYQNSAEFRSKLATKAWRLLSDAYTSSNFDDDYFEGLCLMASRDFAGKV